MAYLLAGLLVPVVLLVSVLVLERFEHRVLVPSGPSAAGAPGATGARSLVPAPRAPLAVRPALHALPTGTRRDAVPARISLSAAATAADAIPAPRSPLTTVG